MPELIRACSLAILLILFATNVLAETGRASWYAMTTITASGERANPEAMVAAHRTLPFGTCVRVKNLRNGKSVRVRINDRGPFIKGRIIDVSRRAARLLGFLEAGTAPVLVTKVRC